MIHLAIIHFVLGWLLLVGVLCVAPASEKQGRTAQDDAATTQAEGQMSAEKQSYFVLTQPPRMAAIWQGERRASLDRESALFLSTLPAGQEAVGALLSPPFAAPPRLSFWVAGHGGMSGIFLVDAETGRTLRSAPAPKSDVARRVEWDLSDEMGRPVRLKLLDGEDKPELAWLSVGRFSPAVVPPVPAEGAAAPDEWESIAQEAERVEIDGIPFLRRPLLQPREPGATARIELPGVTVERLYLLGAINDPDAANPAWGGGDASRNLFIGDTIGALRLEYADGTSDTLPLILGYTVWWWEPYRLHHHPLQPPKHGGDAALRATLDETLHVARGLDGYALESPNYYLAVRPQAKPLAALVYVDEPAKRGHLRVEGVALEGASAVKKSETVEILEATGPTGAAGRWLEEHTVDATEPMPPRVSEGLQTLRRAFYTFESDLAPEAVDAAPEPEPFDGPQVRFSGPVEATLLTRIFADNAPEVLSYVDPDSGMVHESAQNSDYYGGFGPWRPDLGAFYGDAYTRVRVLALLADMGFVDRAEAGVDFHLKHILAFPQGFPELNIAGKPVPGHATVVANKPFFYPDELAKRGWPTRLGPDMRDYGNPETDGHGLLMLQAWRTWEAQGRPPGWVEQRWDALHEMAEYVPWALENPELSLSEHGLLYSESEGGMTMQSLYANVPVYFGLLGLADMADVVGEEAEARRWREHAQGLQKSMETYFPTQDEEHGDVWDRRKTANWHYNQGVLAPLILGQDYYGYDVAAALPEGWRERTERSYEMIRPMLQPPDAAPAGIGYGQNYFAQTALLLDRTAEATRSIAWLVRLCFAPRLADPYRVPEGASIGVDEAGRPMWRRWGDLGNLHQMGETVYTVHTILGIDDFGADRLQLTLMPRLPLGWSGLEVDGWPVRLREDRGAHEGETADLSMSLTRDVAAGQMSMVVETSRPVREMRVRLGPFAPEAAAAKVTVNGRARDIELLRSGDATWGWVVLGDGEVLRFEIVAVAPLKTE